MKLRARMVIQFVAAVNRRFTLKTPRVLNRSTLRLWGTHSEGDVVHFIGHLAGFGWSRADFASANGCEGSDQTWKHGRTGHRDVMRTEDHFNLGCECCQPVN